MAKFNLTLAFTWLIIFFFSYRVVESKSCSKGCDLALASYYTWEGSNLTFISKIFDAPQDEILSYNPDLPSRDQVATGIRINVPFSCGCVDKQYLAHQFSYLIKSGDTYDLIAEKYFADLVTSEWLESTNGIKSYDIPDVNTSIKVTVSCSCGDERVSKEYGLFVTYPLRSSEDLSSVANESGVDANLLQSYNRETNFSSGSGLVFIPGKDKFN